MFKNIFDKQFKFSIKIENNLKKFAVFVKLRFQVLFKDQGSTGLSFSQDFNCITRLGPDLVHLNSNTGNLR